ncbi:hypothetical protein ACFYM0_02120 [Streptomyces sp. NPDC006487]|uniref:YxiG-like protein n=1 Tax=Streptomyces sp. NPDC006487 TaxID=3364748 RepID=UPI0036B80883
MDTAVLEQMLDETFDQAVVHHGYTDYMRDYEVIVHMTAAPRTGIAPSHLRYLSLVFSDLQVTEVPVGYTPFVTE